MINGHRTICNTLEEIRTVARGALSQDRTAEIKINLLIDEAKDYAQRMSAKLVEYKREKREREQSVK